MIVGAYLFYLFNWGTQQIKALPNIPPDWSIRIDYLNVIAVGVLLILFIVLRPSGILPERKYVPSPEDL